MFNLLNLLRPSRNPEHITCPNCLVEQEAPVRALSIFCKNCRSRIDIQTFKQNVSHKLPIQRWKAKTRTISCPYCHSLQEVLATAMSSYCKNCNQRITMKEDAKSDFNEPILTSREKEIICPHCGSHQNVPSAALSTFCPDCGNRINLQNYQISGRFRGDLDTKGTIYISDDGNVDGNINTGSLIVAGRFKGEIIAEEKVQVQSTAKLYGKIRAPALEAFSGAILVGHLHIGKA